MLQSVKKLLVVALRDASTHLDRGHLLKNPPAKLFMAFNTNIKIYFKMS